MKMEKKYIVYHTRFDNGQEYHEPRVHQYFLNQDGWPCMLPYATDGETIAESGYGISEVAGTYYVIDQEPQLVPGLHMAPAI